MAAPSHFWHGFTDMSVISHADPVMLVRGEGEYLFDSTGKKYLDASAGLWNANIGHGRREIAQAAYDQITKLETYSTFGDFTNEPIEELATRVAGLVPIENSRIFFTSGGSDTTYTASSSPTPRRSRGATQTPSQRPSSASAPNGWAHSSANRSSERAAASSHPTGTSRKSTQLPGLFSELAAHPAVSEVRTGEGLMAAIWLHDHVVAENPKLPAQIVATMRREGVLTRSLVNGQIQFSPALTSGTQHAREFAAAALTGLDTAT